MKIKGAIFDMDGTLLDSMHIWAGAASNYVRSRGMEPPEGLDQAVQVMTMPECAAYMKERFNLPEPEEQLMDLVYQSVGMAYARGVAPKEGVVPYLQKLAAAKIPMAVATATDRMMSYPAIEKAGILPFFKSFVTCREIGHGKENPAVFEAACEQMGTPKEETIVVEDSIYAIKTAKDAGFPVLAVYDVYSAAYWDRICEIADEAVLNLMDSEVFTI